MSSTFLKRVAITGAMGCAFADCAAVRAGLVIDLRATRLNGVPLGPAQAHSVQGLHLGDTLAFDVFAIVAGTNANTADDRILSASGSFRTDTIGGVFYKGNIAMDVVRSVTDPDTGDVLVPGFDKNGFSVGMQADLDGDGDLDVGSNVNSSPADFWAVRYNTPDPVGAPAGPPDGVRVGFGTLFITSEPFFDGQDHIRFYGRNASLAATYIQDGQLISEATQNSALANSITIIKLPEPVLTGPLVLVALAARRRRRSP